MYIICNIETPKETLTKALRAHDLSATRARFLVFTTLRHKDAMSMHELIESLDGQINRASVYRTIDLFERLHIVERITIGWKYKLELSDQFSPHHHHIICENCGKIDELEEESPIEDSLRAAAQKLGYDLHAHQIELRGLCSSCEKH